ncbi:MULTISPECIES: SRPBCC family protein [Bacteria]|uniref:Polyketide cyclase n=4 Tax=Sphingomonas TaxID=13687 RepID=A0A0D1MDV7_9SPHN|nr:MULTISPECIES: SRPBCC family protein [Bacteria]KIU25961.1 polyketide cyclase [Sphingomonas melonis]MBB3877375.1 hypothetical protein [Sphingomonas aquatilis]MBB4049168.1 hypothetical protein [Sphingomonas zeae]MBB4619730.1 hypothetical protein [Sphingomonas abaci]MBI0533537.1 SRPBCC domain-containing protein [Sphingomonas sp. TX0522]
MPEITISRVFHGPPLRIWSALIEPEHRQAWRPMIQLDDASQVGETQCTFAFPGWSRSVRSPAEVDHLDKPRAFAWSCGIPHVFMIEERFELQGDDGGTTVSHSCALRGLLSLPIAAMVLRRLRVLMIEADDRLAAYLHWRAGQAVRGADRRRIAQHYRRKVR